MPIAEKFDIDYFQDLKKAGMPEEQATVILRLIKTNNQELINKMLTKTDIKELEWKIEGLRKDTTTAIESLRAETKIEIQQLKTETEKLKSELIEKMKNSEIKLLTIMGSMFLILVGILAKGFHWF